MNRVGTLPKKFGTIMLVSGDFDKALAAFDAAVAFQAMGMQMTMWFVLYGTNCLRRPKSAFLPSKWWGRLGIGPGRRPETDLAVQHLVNGLNPAGVAHLPLSQLNFWGIGPAIFRHIMRRKGMASLEALIYHARDLGVRFTICQTCVDALAFSVPDDLIVEADVRGASSYFLDVEAASYNVTF